MMWTEKVRGPRAGMVIHQILMERVHVWVWHEKLEGRQPTTLSQPPPATESQRQAEFTPRAVGTWATGNEEGRMLCHADQQNQCADSSCSIGAHGFAILVHYNCHVRSMKRPACKHRWGKKAAKRKISEDSMRNKRWWGPAVGTNDSSRPEVGRKQATEVGQYLDCPYATSHSGSYNRHHDSPGTVSTKQHQPRDHHKPQMT